VFRVLLPAAAALRHGRRVAGVVTEGPGVVSLRIEGRRLDRLQARAGQFFIWRFLAPGLWWSAHPFSLSQLPDGRSLRITVKALGDHSLRLAEVPVGTRVVAEGPFGVFTSAVRRRAKVLLIAGGIGITPVRALVEEMHGELDQLAVARGIELRYVVGDHATEDGARLLTAAHLRELVPDIEDRDVYVCGPPAMTDVAVREARGAGVARRHIHAERFAL
jgi:ferredoxin-NADP reductase